MDDRKQLREYAENGSEAAFQGLVSRHVNMVYSAALRQLRDSHLAQDVTQAVFILLARKAASLKSSVTLSGWLYRTTSHVASRARRDRIRQQHREEEASMMIANEPAEELWEKLAPHLDAAIGTLGEIDRDAVVLRFLQQRSFREVAETLSVSEDAAKKRVTRALEKLRATLTTRGIMVTSAILVTSLSAKAVATAPASVVAAAMSAVGTSVASATAMTLAGMVARQWFLSRLKWATVFAGGAALVVLVATQMDIFKTSSRLLQNEVAEVASTSTDTSAASEGMISKAATPPLPTNPRTMRLKVVSSKDGSPLPEALARVVFYGSKYIVVNTVADTNGVMEIARPDRPYEGMAFWISALGHVPKCLSWERGEELSLPGEYQVKLDPGVRVSGRVVDEHGQSVAGATLHFNGEGMKWNARDYLDYRYPPVVPTSDAQGEWAVDFLAARPQVSGYVKHQDYAATKLSFSMTDGGTANVIVTIRKGAPISGIVLGANQEPLPNAKLAVDWQWDEIKTTTDSDGRFNFAHVMPSRFRLNTSAEGYQPLEQWHELSAEGIVLTNRLTPMKVAGNATLRGRVEDETGKSIPGIRVSLSYGQPALEGVDWSALTDDEGHFAWTQAPEGIVRLSFGSLSYEHRNDVELTSDGVERVIRMEALKALVVRCLVTDQLSGKPISSFKVAKGKRMVLPNKEEIADVRFAGEGAEGVFTFRHKPSAEESLLRFEAEGYFSENVSLPEKFERDLDLAVTMEPATDIEGIVLSPQAAPATGAQVALVGAGLSVMMQQPARFLLHSLESRGHATVARDDGSFRLAGRKEGERLVVAHDEGWAIVPLADFAGGFIYLKPWGRVEGVLQHGQAPIANENVTVRADYSEADTIPYNFTFKTDATGRFRYDKVPPGRARISRYLLTPFSKDGTGFGANTQEKSIDVKAGESLHLTLGGTGVSVIGRLVLQSSREDVAFELYPQNLRPAHLKPDPTKLPTGYGFFCQPDGSFIIEDVPPGDYVLETRVNAVRDRHKPESAFSSFTVGERKLEVLIPENQSKAFDLGEIVVPVRNDAIPQGVR